MKVVDFMNIILIIFIITNYYTSKNRFMNNIKRISQSSYRKSNNNIKDLTIRDINMSYYIIKPFHFHKYKSLIVYGVTSRCDSYKNRMNIRKTWKRNVKYYNSLLFFFIGKSHFEYYNFLIEREELIYNDIIQLSFFESYFNLTILTIWMVKWVIENCAFFYFVKNDQDVIPNLKLVDEYLNRLKQNNCSYGILSSGESACRNSRSKTYIPISVYNESILPIYMYGFFAIYNYKLLYEINRISFDTYPIIYKEDVHMGLLARQSNYSFCSLKYIVVMLNKNSYNFLLKNKQKVIAIHGINANNIYEYYRIIQ